MAYLNFTPLHGNAVAAPPELLAEAGFSALEWQVIALARRDRLSSLRNPGRTAKLLGLIFGSQGASSKLADHRLEALRRLAVLAWHRGPALPKHEVEAFHAAGFTPAQHDMLIASVGRG